MNPTKLIALALVANALVACDASDTTTESGAGQSDPVVEQPQTESGVEQPVAPEVEEEDNTFDLIQVSLDRIDTESGNCANYYWDLTVDNEQRIDQSAADQLAADDARVVLDEEETLQASDFRFSYYKAAADPSISLETILFAANQGADEGAQLVGADVDTFDGENGSMDWGQLRELGGFSGDFNVESAGCNVRVRYSVTVVSSGWIMGR